MTRADVGRDPVWAPALSRDGLRLTYIARQEGRTAVVERPTQGGAGRVVFEYRGEGVMYLGECSWDGKSVRGRSRRTKRPDRSARTDRWRQADRPWRHLVLANNRSGLSRRQMAGICLGAIRPAAGVRVAGAANRTAMADIGLRRGASSVARRRS